MPKKIILLTLRTFSTTGGIQKMTRTLGYSLTNISKQKKWDFKLWSLYDSRFDLMTQYVQRENFVGFGRNKIKMGWDTLTKGIKGDVVILSHINLAMLGIIIKILRPKCRIWLIAHGIEVWRPLNLPKRLLMRKIADKVICVSNFTKDQMIYLHQVKPEKCIVLNNVVDPFIKHPKEFEKPDYLLNRYGLTKQNQIIFTLTRLASSEQYKGYEQVLKAIGTLKNKFPHVKYILGGPYDRLEETRINDLIKRLNIEQQVVITGYIKESELSDYFLLADLFVLPSKKEGFGIVFIEALSCGLRVICGNADGSVDAIRNGELGTAINVDDQDQLETAIITQLEHPPTIKERKGLQHESLRYFNENGYYKNILQLINESGD
jgi:phosphatidylinositol alpha-1,6-mannosyltransferase